MEKKSLGKFLAGALVGVGIGMLFAPKKGSELRQDLKVKMTDLIEQVKEIDYKEVRDNITQKINELKKEIEELDKEKTLELAKGAGEKIKVKANELVEYTKEKGTPVLEKTAEEIRKRALAVSKEAVAKLEAAEKK